MTKKQSSPKIGIGYREEIHAEIFKHTDQLDCLEIISEMFFPAQQKPLLNNLLNQFTIIPHGLNLSIASVGINRNYLEKLKHLVKFIDPPYYSDHLALTGYPGIAFNNLTPIFLFQNQLDIIVNNVNFIQDSLQRPLVLENITQLIRFPGEMSAPEFVHELVRRTSCGILLDITNTYVDSVNYQFNSENEIGKWPLESVYHIHLSGGHLVEGEMMDGHDARIEETSWKLFEKYIPRMPKLHTVIIERDANFSDFSELISEVNRIKSILEKDLACKN